MFRIQYAKSEKEHIIYAKIKKRNFYMNDMNFMDSRATKLIKDFFSNNVFK